MFGKLTDGLKSLFDITSTSVVVLLLFVVVIIATTTTATTTTTTTTITSIINTVIIKNRVTLLHGRDILRSKSDKHVCHVRDFSVTSVTVNRVLHFIK